MDTTTIASSVERRLRVTQGHLISSLIPSSSISTHDTCGIVGFVGKEEAFTYLIEGLSILQSRGYDSAGVTTISDDNQLVTTKYASSATSTSDAIERVKGASAVHRGHTVGIAHTRWATHGGKTDRNAHPHMDAKERVAVVHNGVIENSGVLRDELEKKGIVFKSETDTEVISQLLGIYMHEGMNIFDAIKASQKKLHGTYGVAIVVKDQPGQIIAMRNGSPMCVGVGQGRMFVASEPGAFSRHTKDFISLENGEVAVLRADGHSLDISRVEQASQEEIHLTPDPFPHWTIKEIMEQPMSVARALNYGGRISNELAVKMGGFEENKDTLLPIHHLIITGCGTSFFAGIFGAKIMRSLGIFETVQVVDSAEVNLDTFPSIGAGVCLISQSGETKDVHRVLNMAEGLAVPRFSIVNAVGSLIARGTNCGAYLNAGREHAVASTKAFTSQVTVLVLVALWFAQHRNSEESKRRQLIDALHRLPTAVGMSIQHCKEQCKKVAAKLLSKKNMFILGKGNAEPIAYEGALKIKEITYMHAEGYSGGALKHGPFALIEQDTPIILIILDDQHAQLMRIAAEEVRARGAYTIIITNALHLAKNVAHETILIPSNGVLTALLATIPLQLIAYELSVAKGIDPDKPRNLAKAVTVD
eukprot:TRINITY_DN1698_c0_g1_i1.p1 TRINITY_DN1698_c0_g1~~TRINITY_DN1698_c0_g1_i1.p1  ORF type:complete len:646 (-),score=226.58 TRINITY_DN1698_c0_g1_i1:66-2003(-)